VATCAPLKQESSKITFTPGNTQDYSGIKESVCKNEGIEKNSVNHITSCTLQDIPDGPYPCEAYLEEVEDETTENANANTGALPQNCDGIHNKPSEIFGEYLPERCDQSKNVYLLSDPSQRCCVSLPECQHPNSEIQRTDASRCVEDTIQNSNEYWSTNSNRNDYICCEERNYCKQYGPNYEAVGVDYEQRACQSTSENHEDPDSVCCVPKSCPGVWIPLNKKDDECREINESGTTRIQTYFEREFSSGEVLVCCDRKVSGSSIIQSIDFSEAYKIGERHTSEICTTEALAELDSSNLEACEEELEEMESVGEEQYLQNKVQEYTPECENEVQNGLAEHNAGIGNCDTSRAAVQPGDPSYNRYVQQCVKNKIDENSACAQRRRVINKNAKEAMDNCITLIKEDSSETHTYKGMHISECYDNTASSLFADIVNIDVEQYYCDGVMEGVKQVGRNKRNEDSLIDWSKWLGGSTADMDNLLGGISEVASWFDADWWSNTEEMYNFLLSDWGDGSFGLGSILNPISNALGGFRDLSPSTQLDNFCEGKGFYGSNPDLLGIEGSDLVDDSNNLVNAVVSRQSYFDCAEGCNEEENRTAYMYIFTWEIGGFQENVSYNIWLTNHTNNNPATNNNYCLKIDEGQFINNNGQQISKNCWDLVLLIGDSHTTADTMIARFLNEKYNHVCINYKNLETGTPIELEENDDINNPLNAFNMQGDIVESLTGNDALYNIQNSADSDNDFVCFDIRNDDGDLQGDPVGIYTRTNQEGQASGGNNNEPAAQTTTGIN